MGHSWIRDVVSLLIASRDLVLPPMCRLCGQMVTENQDFCGDCDRQLGISEVQMQRGCPRCAMPCKSTAEPGSSLSGPESAQAICVHCRGKRLHFDGVAALWAYQARVCDAVVAAKYTARAALGDALGRRLGECAKERFCDDPPELVTFVPSHPTRQLARGGNANQVIAGAVAGRLQRRCTALLRTTRRISKQAWLDDSARVRNVCGAFALKKGYAWSSRARLAGSHVMVVDDVLTTGATANEVARVLREGGVRRVSLAVVARALRD